MKLGGFVALWLALWLASVATRTNASTAHASYRHQFRDAYQIVGNQVEHEIGADAGNAAVLGLAHGAVLLAPAEDAFNHFAPCLRFQITVMARRSAVPSACVTSAATARPLRFSIKA